jgi:hypothetical protein
MSDEELKSGEIQLRVINPRPPRRGPAKLPRTILRSLFRVAQWYPVPVFLGRAPERRSVPDRRRVRPLLIGQGSHWGLDQEVARL